MKKIVTFVGVILVVLLIAAVGIGIFIGPIIKTGVETLGPKITQVPIKLDGVDVSFLSGSAAIKGLVVGNPEGYSTPQAIKLGKAEVKLDPMSVISEKVVIHAIHVESPEIAYEGSLKENNLSRILENVNASAQKSQSTEEQASQPAANAADTKDAKQEAQKPAPKIQVDDFLIASAKVHVNLKGLMKKEMTVTLPDIHLTDLGKGNEGITPEELVKVVLSQINLSTIKAVTQAVSESGEMIKDIGKDFKENPEKKIKDVVEGLGGLFGK